MITKRRWSRVEFAILKRCVDKHKPMDELKKLFPYRTEQSIRQKIIHADLSRPPKGGKGQDRGWPGMDGGRHAYDMSLAEWQESPDVHHYRMLKKYCRGDRKSTT